jgi:hypothetical protein
VILAGARKGCEWEAAVERAEAAGIAEETKEVAAVKWVTPKSP